jgi:transcription antitermination factor NusG
MSWYVLRTLAQRERWVAAELRRACGLRGYVPIERTRVRRGERSIECLRPMIPSYLFVAAVDGDLPWRDIAETRHVIGYLTSDGAPAVLTETELDRVRQFEAQLNAALRFETGSSYRIGERVEMRLGPLTVPGILRELRGGTVRIETTMFGTARNVTVPLGSIAHAAG